MELPPAFPIKICETRLETMEQKEAWSSPACKTETPLGFPPIQIECCSHWTKSQGQQFGPWQADDEFQSLNDRFLPDLMA
jgi:hypothetical protein